MFCNKCGKEIPDSSTFCNFCGAEVSASLRKPSTNTNGQQKPAVVQQEAIETPRSSAAQSPITPEAPNSPSGIQGGGEKAKTKKTVLIISIAASVVLIGIILTGVLLMNQSDGSEINGNDVDPSFHVSRETATTDDATNEYKQNEATENAEEQANSIRNVLYTGNWSLVATVPTDVELEGCKHVDITPVGKDIITFHPDGIVSGISEDFDTGEVIWEGEYPFEINDEYNAAYVWFDKYEINHTMYDEFRVFYINEDGYLVETVVLEEEGAGIFYQASKNINLYLLEASGG